MLVSSERSSREWHRSRPFYTLCRPGAGWDRSRHGAAAEQGPEGAERPPTAQPPGQPRAHLGAEHGGVVLHGALHVAPDLGGGERAAGVADLVQVGNGGLAGVRGQRLVRRAGLGNLACGGSASWERQQRVCASGWARQWARQSGAGWRPASEAALQRTRVGCGQGHICRTQGCRKRKRKAPSCWCQQRGQGSSS